MSKRIDNLGFVFQTENHEIKEDIKGVVIEGIAMPLGKKSRNGFVYRAESVERNRGTLVGKPILFNHDEDRVIGHVTDQYIEGDKLYFKGDVDPGEKDLIRKMRRGDISKMSIQAIVENTETLKDGTIETDIVEFLEVSPVTIPGYEDTSIQVAEKLNAKKTRECKLEDCVEFMIREKKLTRKNAKKLCAYIRNGSNEESFDPENPEINAIAEFLRGDFVAKRKEQDGDEDPEDKNEVMAMLGEIKASVSELDARMSSAEEQITKIASDKEEKPKEKDGDEDKDKNEEQDDDDKDKNEEQDEEDKDKANERRRKTPRAGGGNASEKETTAKGIYDAVKSI